MAEPILKDVLDAVLQVRDGLVRVEKDLAAHRAETAARFESMEMRVDTLGAKIDAHRAETAKGFAELDAEPSRHADRTHRDLEQRVERLEKQARPAARPARRPRAR